MSDVVAIAWAAGLFEGEGSIGFRTNKQGWRFGIRLSMSMTDKDVVERFARIVDCGNISGPIIPRPGTKAQWRWQTSKVDDVAKVGDWFRPHFGNRRGARLDEVLAAYHAQPARQNYNRAKTHCRRGHAYAGTNVIYDGGRRRCRICEQARWNRKNARKRRWAHAANLTIEDIA